MTGRSSSSVSGPGRIAVPIAAAGIPVIGVDSSERMLEVCREQAALAGVGELVDLRVGDLRAPPVQERVRARDLPVPRLPAPPRRRASASAALEAARDLLLPGGRLVFDVFTPSQADIDETHDRWIEREPGIFERADWDEQARTLTLSVRGPQGESTMALAWISPPEWADLLRRAGLRDRGLLRLVRPARRTTGGEDTIWVASRPTPL